MKVPLDEHDLIPIPARDAILARTIYSYRFLTAPQVGRLFSFSETEAIRRLQPIVDAGYLAAIKRPVLSLDTPDTVYALGQRGADLLASLSGVDRKRIRWRKYHNQVGRRFLDHRLAVNDVRIALAVGTRAGGGHMRKWLYEPLIKEWSVDDPDDLAPPLWLRPDAYAALTPDTSSPRMIYAFVEVDMGTESNERFASKIRRYLAYKESRLFKARFGGRAFRVLVVATTSVRLGALRRVTESQGGERMFWFGKVADVIGRGVAAPIWRLARDVGAMASLLSVA